MPSASLPTTTRLVAAETSLAAIGTLAAAPVMAGGLADYSTVPRRAAAPATLHGLLNATNTVLYIFSLRDRRHGRRRRGLLISGTALVVAMFSAWLGGELVYRYRVGVSHADSFSDLNDWTPVCRDAEIAEQVAKRAEVHGKPVLLYRSAGRLHAIGATCSHDGAPLDEGTFSGCQVQCPRHHSVFDLGSGEVVHGPATQPQPRFETRLRNGYVEIRPKRLAREPA